MIRSFARLLAVDPGLAAERLLMVRMRLPSRESVGVQLEQQLKARVEATAGVGGFGLISYPPFAHPGWEIGYGTDADRSRSTQEEGHQAFVQIVTPGVFAAMGIPLLEGRRFTDDDILDETKVAIVSRRVAAEHWPASSAVGRHITPSIFPDKEPLRVIGVVADVHQRSLEGDAAASVYLPRIRRGFTTFAVVRVEGRPADFVGAVSGAIREVDPGIHLLAMTPMDELVLGSTARPRFLRWLLVVLSGVALLLAMVGTYGVTSCHVAARVPEIGVRMAVGASPREVFRLLLGRGARLALAGVGLGILVALMLSRVLDSLLYEIDPTDFATFAAAGLVMLAVTIAACVQPAVRAARTHPAVVLREQ
jgi:predicted permease